MNAAAGDAVFAVFGVLFLALVVFVVRFARSLSRRPPNDARQAPTGHKDDS